MIDQLPHIVDWVFRVASLYCLIVLVKNSNSMRKLNKNKDINE